MSKHAIDSKLNSRRVNQTAKTKSERGWNRSAGVEGEGEGGAVSVEKSSVKWPVVGRGKHKEFQGPDLTQLIWRMGLSLHLEHGHCRRIYGTPLHTYNACLCLYTRTQKKTRAHEYTGWSWWSLIKSIPVNRGMVGSEVHSENGGTRPSN